MNQAKPIKQTNQVKQANPIGAPMATRQVSQTKSIRRKLNLLMFIFITGSFFLAHSVISFFIFDHLDTELKKDIKERAAIISTRAVSFIESNDYLEYQEVLKRLSNLPRFNHVHVYRFENQALSFFASYNKRGFPAMPEKTANIDQFREPIITDSIVEYIHPVMADDKLIGYAYLQLDTNSYHQLQITTWLTLSIGYIVVLIIGMLITNGMYRIVMTPLSRLLSTIRKVSHHKDFTVRADAMETHEFSLLANEVNVMLNRIERHIDQQANAEQQTLKLNQELENKVNQRTDALKNSNQELLSTLEKLHQFQGQLVESEKMASLGDMVAGVAHEVNTPIGLGVTASSLLTDRLSEIHTAFKDKTLKASQLRKFLFEGEENLAIVSRNLQRAADLISSFKQVAVNQSHEADSAIAMRQLINDVILSLAPQLKQKHIDFQIECNDSLAVISKPGPINQILINLIVNSIIHAFADTDRGVVSINVMYLSGQLHINYQDNGKGVEPSIKTKIFDPFITTRRGEGGSGLGLHLVYNLVTQALGGHIHLDNQPTAGAHFEITFPAQLTELSKLS